MLGWEEVLLVIFILDSILLATLRFIDMFVEDGEKDSE